ncbi:hypothetical protein GIB67_013516 [Kingdonia uniflora]|uniref:Uncharacterized protein n=1 Tax=Kingdonia uniflora TaxID=39325 RepID=A0A7J7KUT1_9MAGN|nr:hypothetical protein GIB67_013516 [Kingdonia uniflora]
MAQPNPVKLSKVALKYPKKHMLKAMPASGTIGSGKVMKDKRRRVEPPGDSGEKVARLFKGIWLGIEEEKSELKKLQVGTKANLDEMVEERDRLGRYLMLKGYSEEKADTYVEEEDKEEAEAVGIMDGLDGVSRQTVLNNQGDNVELPEGGSEKVTS